MAKKQFFLIAATRDKKVPGEVPGTVEIETEEALAPEYVLATGLEEARAKAARLLDDEIPLDEVTIIAEQM